MDGFSVACLSKHLKSDVSQTHQHTHTHTHTMPLIVHIVSYVSAIWLVFITHYVVQEMYHRHCKSNLLNILMYGNSDVCNTLSSILRYTETVSKATTLDCIRRVLSG